MSTVNSEFSGFVAVVHLPLPLSCSGKTPLTTPLLASLDSLESWGSSTRFCKKAKELCLPGPFHPATQPITPTGGGISKGEKSIRKDNEQHVPLVEVFFTRSVLHQMGNNRIIAASQ